MWCPNRECVDVQQTGEPGEYRDDVEVCPKCGARLVHQPPEPVPDEGTAGQEADDAGVPEEPLASAAAFNYLQDANLAASMLQANGIPATVFEDSGGVDPRMTFGSRAQVMVSERDLPLARTLLEEEAREPEGEH